MEITLWDLLHEDFTRRAVLGGLGVAVAAGSLGCFVVWRRIAYYGDAMSHSALLGIAAGLALGSNLMLSVAVVSVVLSLGLSVLVKARPLAPDAVLGVFSHVALSLGMIALTLMGNVRLDLHGWLFGDLLALADADVWGIWAAALLVGVALLWLWRPLLAATVNRELALVEGLPVRLAEAVFMVLLAVTVAASLKVVGAVLTTALLVAPPAAARGMAREPEQMILWSVLVGAVSVVGGVLASLLWDLPVGPAVVAVAGGCFFLSLFRR